jgi:8-oxo-dGTP diphosphatase
MNYCLGFPFTRDRRRVLLIRKKRPAWQAGRLNGIGGKVEPGETAYQAMCRECPEETGLNITDWEFFATIQGPGFTVTCYRAFTDDIDNATSLTDELVSVEEVDLQRFFVEGNPSVAPLIGHALRPDSGTIVVPLPTDAGAALSELKVMSYELKAPDDYGDGMVLLDRIRRRGKPDAFVIRRASRVLNRQLDWEWEGSARGENDKTLHAFWQRTRFASESEALSVWQSFEMLSTPPLRPRNPSQ